MDSGACQRMNYCWRIKGIVQLSVIAIPSARPNRELFLSRTGLTRQLSRMTLLWNHGTLHFLFHSPTESAMLSR